MTQHMPDLVCKDCQTESIFTNGDTDCCAECGGMDYHDIAGMSEFEIEQLTEAKRNPNQPLVNLFESWNQIHSK
jgi:Zn finger protein HypA/HybF involved in hydrogenase expression